MRRTFSHGIRWIVVIGVGLVAVQILATVLNARHVDRQLQRIVGQLGPLQDKKLSDEKTRQEVLTLSIQNAMRGFLSNSLLITIGPVVTAFVALVGGLLGLRSYLDTREKEHRDRQDAQEKERLDREKERLDRASTELKDTIERLVNQEPWQRAAGIVGLQHFLTPGMREYQLWALSALVMAARREDDREVTDSLRIATEQAVKSVPEGVLQQVLWQRVKLRGAKFSGRPMRGLDFRDADLENADFTGCDLSGASFTNARLNGATFDRSVLHGADLAYADLAGASLVKADLQRATLYHAKVLRMNIDGADLRGTMFDVDRLPWDLVNHWRKATFDPGLRERLIARYGPEPRGPRVLMLMWEIPPLVAGGTWTACYHLVRNLRKRGADVTVVVPWEDGSILPSPFGCEVAVIPLGIVPPRPVASAYVGVEPPPWSPYGSTGDQPSPWASYQPAEMRGWSSYGATGPYHRGAGSYADSPSGYARAGDLSGGWTILRLVDECRRRFVQLAESEPFDLIHAHDWVTFDAATAAATATKKPWVAHVHSTEPDRRPAQPDAIIERIERQGARTAAHVVVPSHITAGRVQTLYDVAPAKITVAPNTLSREEIPPAETGSFDTKRTIFLGRLTGQKGLDLFAEVAASVRRRGLGADFWAFGEGEHFPQLETAGVRLRGPVDWRERGAAFADASAVLVPSRAEPFGMVVLEAMQRRVPVLYPRDAGAAEVLTTGIRIDPADTAQTADTLEHLLTDRSFWEETALRQAEEVAEYPDRGFETAVIELWGTLVQMGAPPAERR